MVGEVLTYSGGDGYSLDATRTPDGMNWSAGTSGTNTYDVVVFDNLSYTSPERIYLYDDDDYGNVSEQGITPVGSKELTPRYYLEQLEKELDYRGIHNTEFVNATGLRTVLSDTGNAMKCALVIVSGSIPDTVYAANDILMNWVQAGGTLYWAGGPLGTSVSHQDGTTDNVPDGPMRLLGSNCLNPAVNNDEGLVGMVDGTVDDEGIGTFLGLQNNCVLYGVDRSAVMTDSLAVGYTDGTYSSIVFVRCGDGQICVFGGDLTNNQRYDMSQTIASGLCWCSKVLGHAKGSVSHGDTSGTLMFAASGIVRAYLFLGHGEEFPVYGRGFDL